MAERKFHAKLSNGALPIHTVKQLTDCFSTMGDKAVVITVKERKRSLSQNALWFARLEYVVPMLRETGDNWDAWTLHESLVEALGYTKVLHLPDGTAYKARMSTSDMSTKEFSEMIERAEAYLASKGIFLPPVQANGYL